MLFSCDPPHPPHPHHPHHPHHQTNRFTPPAHPPACSTYHTHSAPPRPQQVLVEMVERHQQARAAVTDEIVDAFMATRPMPWDQLYG